MLVGVGERTNYCVSGCPKASHSHTQTFFVLVAQLCPTLCDPVGQHARLPCPSLSPGVCSNSRPLSRWCHPTSSPSVPSSSSCLQSFPASGSFPVSQFFISSGQWIGASASASALPTNIQGWFPLGWTDLIFLLSKGVFNTTVQKYQRF